jgi:hypothetical protein
MWIKIERALPLYGRVRRVGEVVNLDEGLATDLLNAGAVNEASADEAPRAVHAVIDSVPPEGEEVMSGEEIRGRQTALILEDQDSFGAPNLEAEPEPEELILPEDTDEVKFIRVDEDGGAVMPGGFELVYQEPGFGIAVSGGKTPPELKVPSLTAIAQSLKLDLPAKAKKPEILELVTAELLERAKAQAPAV